MGSNLRGDPLAFRVFARGIKMPDTGQETIRLSHFDPDLSRIFIDQRWYRMTGLYPNGPRLDSLYPPFDEGLFRRVAKSRACEEAIEIAYRRLVLHRAVVDRETPAHFKFLLLSERRELYRIQSGTRRQRQLWSWASSLVRAYYARVREPWVRQALAG